MGRKRSGERYGLKEKIMLRLGQGGVEEYVSGFLLNGTASPKLHICIETLANADSLPQRI